MTGITLPGGSVVERAEVPIPEPGFGQVLVEVRASSICGSDIRAIYREHLGSGAEAYQGVIAGHEPCGQIVAVGPGCTERAVGDRVVIYHISGCGQCAECRHGYMIGCESESRAAYGWQRDGGHAPYLLAEEETCLILPDELTYEDGALVSCGFGTAYEGLLRLDVSGRDQLLITGLGPVGLAAGMLAKAMGVRTVVGTDLSAERAALAVELGVVDHALSGTDVAGELSSLAGRHGFSAAIDCSGSGAGRLVALEHLRTWGRCAFVGEGGGVSFDVSPLLIHKQVTLYGSWVTSLRHMEDLLELLPQWQIHPDAIVTHRFGLDQAAEAYRLADGGQAGKICLIPTQAG
ncbi:threonine dehydrogenase-like Zn-dependent dehydrogenase [Microlunatus panaciterrae]|uniref:Threonine dehydrogenase-like Zn-dependent dehydrogenase n=1 Tax=Microlunatus panaciterrae TaxID=400768 RepID=A0ABS2RG67_9ACTN|nr:zinc-binding dehydrogenase [Microlunatus panaciterrae]MBM7797999.1 threonine dehydrogenase-like Zn-dependent dehydrogenase [Microlunatus panaciterrae]